MNKPECITSNKILQQVKRLYQAKKAGHTGSLDPIATGMLPICFGEATKFSQYLLNANKCYQATGLLGIKTTTADLSGAVVAECSNVRVSLNELNAVLAEFKGFSQQIPSMYSALKYQGTPLYKLARAGISIERQSRSIFIDHLELNAFDGVRFQITVNCSKGTYIRNLVEDIGERLGVGAHVIQLHRCYTAGFERDSMYSMNQLTAEASNVLMSYLLPVDRAVIHFPKLELTHADVTALRQGKVLSNFTSPGYNGFMRLYDESGVFVGLVEATDEGLRVKRLTVS